jgi:hypothetical protein
LVDVEVVVEHGVEDAHAVIEEVSRRGRKRNAPQIPFEGLAKHRDPFERKMHFVVLFSQSVLA